MYENLSLMAMAKRSMDWLARRQEVLAENVANANTPGYKARDLEELSFKKTLAGAGDPGAVRAVATNAAHVSPEPAGSTRFASVVDPTVLESKPDGNTVALEAQMEKIGDVKSQYEMASNLFSKNAALIKLALDKGGT